MERYGLIERRAFLGGLTAFAAVGRNRCFAHPQAEPALRLGIISDLHHSTKDDGTGQQNCLAIEPALRYFDLRRADGILVCGDLSEIGTVDSLRAVGAIWDRVFPNGRRSDGTPIENLMHYGDHDMGAYMQKYGWAKDLCVDPEEVKRIIPANDPAKLWEECFHEKWAPIQVKTVKGYTFVLAHHPLHTKESNDGDRIPGLAEFMSGLTVDPTKPFFYSQHRHFEVGDTGKILEKHPNVIAFHGHLHSSCVDELSLSQDVYTKIDVPSLNYCCVRWGRQNSRQPLPDALLPKICCAKSWQGLFASVYADRIVIERRDFLHGLPLGPDWVIPLPSSDGSLRKDGRAKRSAPPQFAPDAKVEVVERTAPNRSKRPVDQVLVRFPARPRTARACRMRRNPTARR